MIIKITQKTKAFIAVTIFLVSADALSGDDIRGNVYFNYSQYKFSDFKSNSYNLGSTIYISPVKFDNHPWLEAPFLNRASSIYVEFNRHIAESTNDIIGSDGVFYSLSGNYASKTHPVILAADYLYHAFAVDSPFSTRTSRSDTYALSIGSYLGNNSALIADYSRETIRNRDNTNINTYGILIKSVLEFSNQQALTFNGSASIRKYNDDSKINHYLFSPVYFVTPRLSIEVPLAVNRGPSEYTDNKSAGVGVHTFFGSNFSAKLRYSKTFPDFSIIENSSSISLSAYIWY